MGKDTSFSVMKTIVLRGKTVDFSRPLIMGVLNLTPDSFYDGGRYTTDTALKERLTTLVSEGSDIIDVGAVSSRPGAELIPEEEEINRLRKGLELLRSLFPDIPVSVDTFRSAVATMAVKHYEVDMINDISAGEMDPRMFSTIAGLRVPYCMMHMAGTPKNMQDHPEYTHVVREVVAYFSARIAALREHNVCDIVVDPGFGFGKTPEHNYQLLRELSAFSMLEVPIMVGVSRKSMIYKLLGTTPEDALNGTTVLNTLALLGGANILRVHDPHEAREVVELVMAYSGETP